MPRPGSNVYDIKRARLRKYLENSGIAVDKTADELANDILQRQDGYTGIVRTERGLGPRGEAGRSDRRRR